MKPKYFAHYTINCTPHLVVFKTKKARSECLEKVRDLSKKDPNGTFVDFTFNGNVEDLCEMELTRG